MAAEKVKPRSKGRRRSCRQKRKYVSENQAWAGIRGQAWNRPEGVTARLRPYKCPCCTGWHLTSQRPEEA